MKLVSEHAADILRETDNDAVVWGDVHLVHLIAERAGVRQDGPPTMARVLDALTKRPGPLVPGLTRLGNARLVRIFRLKGKK